MIEKKLTSSVIICAIIVGLITSAIFLLWPELDLAVSGWFFVPGRGFIGQNAFALTIVRYGLIAIYGCFYAAIIIFGFDSLQRNVRHLGLKTYHWLYLGACSVLGPLVLTNLILKNNWGRARPYSVTEFGGDLEFSRPILISDQCGNNCSFVAGEPSSMFMMFVPFMFLFPRHAMKFAILAIGAGLASGVMRISQGGHFLSDVIMAGVFMFALAAVLYRWMFLSNWAYEHGIGTK